jgi:hypothetical protein
VSCIQTVAGRGYRFVASVKRVEPASPPISSPISGNRGGELEGEYGRGASLAALLPTHDKPSIAVLPFANLSSDSEQEYFVDGMVEEIIFSNRHFSGVLDPPPLPEFQRFTRLILAHRHP